MRCESTYTNFIRLPTSNITMPPMAKLLFSGRSTKMLLAKWDFYLSHRVSLCLRDKLNVFANYVQRMTEITENPSA